MYYLYVIPIQTLLRLIFVHKNFRITSLVFRPFKAVFHVFLQVLSVFSDYATICTVIAMTSHSRGLSIH